MLRFLPFLLLFFSCFPGFSESHPNILFILIDDLGWKDLSHSGSSLYETPHIDSLAKEGVNFTRANMAAPRCVSSRVGLMTGQYPYRNRIKNKEGISRNIQIMPEAFKKGGYRTFFAGKWHLGHTENEYPDKRGFDSNIGGSEAGSPKSYWFPFSHEDIPMPGLEKEKVKGEYLTDRLTQETEEFIRTHVKNNRNEPFFAFLSHYGVHTPLEGKPDLVAKYEKKLAGMKSQMTEPETFRDHTGRVKRYQNNPVYAAMVESIDESVGRLRMLLKELKIDKDTIIVFTSDHGGLSTTKIGGQREIATSNLPLRTGKGWLYEGGLRVPLLVLNPRTRGGFSADTIVNGTDIYPTLLDMAGLDLEEKHHLDGYSFYPAIQGVDHQRPKPIISHYMFAKLGTGNTAMSVVIDKPYKLVWLEVEQQHELYHLENDPGELHDLSEAQPEVLARLEKVRQSWLKELNIKPLKKSHNFYTTTLKLLKKRE